MITLTYSDKKKLAADISLYKHEWNSARSSACDMWAEIDSYIHATDTSMLEGGEFFDHKTFIPIISEIHEDLIAIIFSTVFPHEDWLSWKGYDVKAIATEKRRKLISMIKQIHALNGFSTTFRKVIDDLVRYGNCFTKVNYVNETETEEGETVSGYLGPKPIRISPYDIVFNPSAAEFSKTPKIITSLISTGEFKEFIEGLGEKSEITDEQLSLLLNRRAGGSTDNSDRYKDQQYLPAGFGTIKEYYTSGMIELLWFYGDIYDEVTQKVHKGRCVIVVDGNTVIYDGYEPKSKIFKGSWKPRPDNLWSQGPLDNLIGINYMINHRENSKNDSIDKFANPDRAYVGDVEEIYDEVTGQTKYIMPEGGSVNDITPDATVLTYDNQIQMHTEMARRAARIPQQLTGFKTSGEKTAFEVQKLDDGAFRGFINKAMQFEEDVIEPSVTAELRVAKENFSTVISVLEEDEEGIISVLEVTEEDLSSNGKLIPFGARRFARSLQQLAGLQNLTQGPMYQILGKHFNTYDLARVWESLNGFENYQVIKKFAAIDEAMEEQEATMLAQQEMEQTMSNPTALEMGMDAEMEIDDEL
tara:strand:- start:931 stop:2688 length:1758 start_codon:yes stop_codon:yes gene_type:complete